jgi:hypothetical protein
MVVRYGNPELLLALGPACLKATGCSSSFSSSALDILRVTLDQIFRQSAQKGYQRSSHL